MRELHFWKRHSPLVAKAFTIDVKVWTANPLAIGVAMGSPTETEPHQYHYLPCPGLICSPQGVDATPMHVEQKALSLID
jgi:hypothetical protein